MANDGKIYITISDRRFGNNKAEADEQNKLDKEKNTEKEGISEKFLTHKFFNLVESQARQALNYSISNIGNFTGDYVTQQHISDSMQILNFLIETGTSVAAGAKMGGWVGALVALGITGVTKTISTAQQFYAGEIQNRRTNRDIAQLKTRAGLNSTNNGNRGTEY